MNQSNDLFELIEKLDRYRKENITLSGTGGGKSGGINCGSGRVFGVDNEIIDLKGGDDLKYLKMLELSRCYGTTMYE